VGKDIFDENTFQKTYYSKNELADIVEQFNPHRIRIMSLFHANAKVINKRFGREIDLSHDARGIFLSYLSPITDPTYIYLFHMALHVFKYVPEDCWHETLEERAHSTKQLIGYAFELPEKIVRIGDYSKSHAFVSNDDKSYVLNQREADAKEEFLELVSQQREPWVSFTYDNHAVRLFSQQPEGWLKKIRYDI